jgi:hypothetical protein
MYNILCIGKANMFVMPCYINPLKTLLMIHGFDFHMMLCQKPQTVLDIEYMNKRLALTPKLVGPIKYALADMILKDLKPTIIQFKNVNRP